MIGDQQVLDHAESLSPLYQAKAFLHILHRNKDEVRMVLRQPLRSTIPFHHGYLPICQFLEVSDITHLISGNDGQWDGKEWLCEDKRLETGGCGGD